MRQVRLLYACYVQARLEVALRLFGSQAVARSSAHTVPTSPKVHKVVKIIMSITGRRLAYWTLASLVMILSSVRVKISFSVNCKCVTDHHNHRYIIVLSFFLGRTFLFLILLALQPTVGFSLLSYFLPFFSFFTLLSPPSYPHYLQIFFNSCNPSLPWSPSSSRTYRFPL